MNLHLPLPSREIDLINLPNKARNFIQIGEAGLSVLIKIFMVTIERCYKLHDYPRGYNKTNKSKEVVANQLHSCEDTSNTNEEAHTLLTQINATQYQQLLNLFAN